MTVRKDVLAFLRNPEAFAATATDPDVWLAGLEDFALPSIAAEQDRALRVAQVAAWRGLADRRTGLILGPPGTGKTHLLSWLITGYGVTRAGFALPARTFVTAFTKNAVGNVLDAVVKRQALHARDAPRPFYYGAPPAAGLSDGVVVLGRGDEDELLDAIGSGRAVVGATIWSLYRLLTGGGVPSANGPTAPLFDLICIDEASQMVLGHGLMALAGLAPGGRVVVAGDDQQLPPVRAARETRIAGRDLGGSLYAFLKSAKAAEFALDETFRLNEPLANFPERKFYPGQYVSAVPENRLALRSGWMDGLDLVSRVALDPALPVVVLVHDGPAAATANPFEAGLVARLATALEGRVVDADGAPTAPDRFWTDVVAIVSPHRAQNAAIRRALPDSIRANAFVETVDRIQGKERDVVLLSYCVADPEFALAEGDFIFSPERLNVASTRARTKLVLIVSRRLLECVPTEQEVMDKAEVLREFVFSCDARTEIELDGPAGRLVRLQVRTRGFTGEEAALDLTPNLVAPAPPSEMTLALEGVLKAIRHVATQGRHGSAALSNVRKALARPSEPFAEARALHLLGWVSLEQRTGPYGLFWSARPFETARRVYPADLDTLRARIELVVREAKSGRYAFYDRVRDRFAWMTEGGKDALLPILQRLEAEGLVTLGAAGGSMTVELPKGVADPLEPEGEATAPELRDADFELLNSLERLESNRINFGVFDAWTSVVELARKTSLVPDDATEMLSRLEKAGHVILADDSRVRTRMAELGRELRYVKQRFRSDDADRRPYLVRSLKIELLDRDKPKRDHQLTAVINRTASQATDVQAQALRGLGSALVNLWGEGAALAAFQVRGLEQGLAAWHGDGPPTLAIAADTGSGKTEAAVLPIIAGALADRLQGVDGVRAVLAYPRIRLAANQAQRLAGYLAACATVPELPLLTLGLQVGDVPNSFESMHLRYQEAWKPAGPDAFIFPFFACPQCAAPLRLKPGGGYAGADALICSKGDWRYDGWIGSKAQLQVRPPAIFLPTTDSLHQWMHDDRQGALFGDSPKFKPPRALLADEIHLYTHIHGAQVGLALRRLAVRAQSNDADGRPMVAIGMSATIGNPARSWGKLIGRDHVAVIRPTPDEADPNPRGREYFYFIQPEVESRGSDIAGASTTIQSLMCLGHGMRRRTGKDGGYRSLVFFDSIDKMRRLHGAYVDAEEGQELAAYRTKAYGDDARGEPQTACCGEPVGCDHFSDGECWWFAANDLRQRGAHGLRRPGAPLRVARTPIYSGTSSDAEGLVKGADVVFATSSLEVGYDDPDITLVYQHYAPQNLASFVQRKGRGGRGVDDRPITAVTLSLYSPRDSWWFRRPHEMVSPSGFEMPLNPDNVFVRRGQALSALLDSLARWQFQRGQALDNAHEPVPEALTEAGRFVEMVLGANVWQAFGVRDVVEFWSAARAASRGTPLRFFTDLRKDLIWAPDLLFDTVNLPAVTVDGPEVIGGGREDVSLVLPTVAPGNATRRFNPTVVHWLTPQQGKAPWFAQADYATAHRHQMRADAQTLLSDLPLEARALLNDLHTDLCRPVTVTLERLGRVAGAHWTGELGYSQGRVPAIRSLSDGDITIRHDSRGELRGFLLVEADRSAARALPTDSLSTRVAEVTMHAGSGVQSSPAGLTVARVFWGADAEVRLDQHGAEPVAYTQTFVDPETRRPLLHGYQVETEGIRIRLDSVRLDAFVAEVQAEMEADEGERRWRGAQFTRYLVESRARSLGLNAYEARRGADLIVAAAGDSELRQRLSHLLKFWSGDRLGVLFEDTRAHLLAQHPMMTARRVAKTAAALSGDAFRMLVQESLAEASRPEAMAGYLRSLVLHSLALRLKQSITHVAQGDDRRLLAHVRLPVQFGGETDDVITICEAGACGDGTIRAVQNGWDRALAHWSDGFLAKCPNADEDSVLRRFWEMNDRHDAWRALDPRDPTALAAVAVEILPEAPHESLPGSLIRILFGMETVEAESFALYDLAYDLEGVRQRVQERIGRTAQDWEIATAAVADAESGATQTLARLHSAYAALDGATEGSLSPDARLADQAYRLGAPLCVDGCRGCVQQPSDLMTDSLVQASVSQRLLARFLA
ncbi:AAA domain-containing protein [Mesorhizobium sp. M0960]|uniref:AAA domain-containing protein n=1 Tax=Mesorhizobium sp. M0960 TaxID=2957035 RepID=UPI00333B38AA